MGPRMESDRRLCSVIFFPDPPQGLTGPVEARPAATVGGLWALLRSHLLGIGILSDSIAGLGDGELLSRVAS